MAFLFRWVLRGFFILTLLAGATIGLAYYLASQSLPQYDRAYIVTDAQAPFDIVRDRHAIPHILSDSNHDAFFGLGFVHAQDRLWQMTLMRRTAQGRLSELFGRETLQVDELMRSLDIYGRARLAARDQDTATNAALAAYSDGVNAWLHVVQEEALGRGAPEFFLFDASIAPWVPADSIALQKLMALQMTDKAQLETLRAKLSLYLPAPRVEDLMPLAPNEPIMGLPEFSYLFPESDFEERGGRKLAQHPLNPIRPLGLAGASNVFAVTAERTAGGAALLGSDPHSPLSVPSLWYLARLNLETGGVIGGTIPGIPVVFNGRNETLAWGMTTSYLDDQDIYIERLNPDNPDEYLTPDGFEAFEARDAVIAVKNAGDEIRQLRWTRHGPVIAGEHFGVGDVTPKDHVATLAWTGLAREDRSIGAMLGVMRAQNIREARDALADFLAPSSMVALTDGKSVALQMAGAVPRRRASHTSKGIMPAPGWIGANDWLGLRPYGENPWVVDPPSGVVVNTNNRITDAEFPDNLSHDWGDAVRIERAGRLLAARQFHTLDSFIELQTDTVSEAARTLLPLIARDLWYSETVAEPGSREAMRREALELLANWNGNMSEHTPEPLIYAAWIRALQRRLVIDELGALTEIVSRPEPMFLERVYRDTDGASIWCDVIQSSARESCSETSSKALDDALSELEQRFGSRLKSWRWGDAHQALHEHLVVGRIPVLRYLVNIRQSTPGGDHTLMRGRMLGTGDEPYLNIHGSGMRAVHDFSDPDSSVFISSTGQSGHVLSRHYDDLAALWRRSEYVPMSLDETLARAGATGVSAIQPQ